MRGGTKEKPMTANNRTLTDSLYTSVMSQELNPQSQQSCTLVVTSVHYVNILYHLHVNIYTFYITSFAYSTLHYLHTIVFTYFTLYIYKSVTLMYFPPFFLADANFRLANFKL